MPVVVAPGKGTASLRHFFFGKFSGELLLLSLAQDSERHFRSFGESLQELSQLARLDIVDDQTKSRRQAKLFTHDCCYLCRVPTEIRDRNLRTFFVMTWHPWW